MSGVSSATPRDMCSQGRITWRFEGSGLVPASDESAHVLCETCVPNAQGGTARSYLTDGCARETRFAERIHYDAVVGIRLLTQRLRRTGFSAVTHLRCVANGADVIDCDCR